MLQAEALLTVKDNGLYDVLRVFAIASGVIILALMAYHTLRRRRPINVSGDRDWTIGVLVLEVLIIAQEAQQLGKPFLIWRCPLFLIANIFILRAVTKRARTEGDDAADPAA